MNFKPLKMGKETEKNLKDSPLGNLNAIDVTQLRDYVKNKITDLLSEEDSALKSWTLLPRDLFKISQELNSKSLALFFANPKWGEPHVDIAACKKELSNVEILLPRYLESNQMDYVPYQEQPLTEIKAVQWVTSNEAGIAPDLIFCPALACDKSGRRVGRGAGFYDRYLSSQKPRPLSCAVLYSDFVYEELPEKFFHSGDQKVDFILSEKEFFSVNNKFKYNFKVSMQTEKEVS